MVRYRIQNSEARNQNVGVYCLGSFVICLSVVTVLSACSEEAKKKKKCAAAREKIIELSLDVEEKLGKLAPEKERWTRDELRKSIESRVDPEGRFIETCVQSLSDDVLDCIQKAKKLSELGRCTE